MKIFKLLESCKLYSSTILLISLIDKIFWFKTFLIFCAICSNIFVGTASPMQCLIFNSSCFKYFFFSIEDKLLSVSKSIFDHLNSFGIVIILISSLILNTLLSLGWIVLWLAKISFLVWIQGATLSQYHREYLSPFLFLLKTIFPSSILCGILFISTLSNADSPSFIFSIQGNIFISKFLYEW